MWQHGNRATPGYSSDITTSWRRKALARDNKYDFDFLHREGWSYDSMRESISSKAGRTSD